MARAEAFAETGPGEDVVVIGRTRQRRATDSVARRQGKPSLPLTYGLRLISHN
jgi:hypothetical protein